MPRPTSIEIDLAALRHNASQLKRIAAPRQFFAVVKADAYGHGAIECSRALETIADGLVVAILEEAVILREAGVRADIIVLQGPHSQGDLAEFSRLELWPVFTDHRQLAWLDSMSSLSIKRAWLKVDTGMHRLGFDLSDVVAAEQQLRKAGIADVGLMSHFAESEVAGSELTAKQLANWQTLTRSPSASFANSSALLQTMSIGDDIARIGYALYGGLLADPIAEIELKQVMSFRSQITSTRWIEVGETVGYNGRWQAARRSRIATIPVGYGDGYPRSASDGTPVGTEFGEVPLAGKVSMDTITVDITDVANLGAGDRVTLWGDKPNIDRVAAYSDTIGYELCTRLPNRVPRGFSG